MFKLDALPRLAIGSHPENSGKACIMNAISYLAGERKITDLPDCVWRPLAWLAQAVNDGICPTEHRTDETGCTGYELCPSCTHAMWMIGTRLIGTGGTNPQLSDIEEITDRWVKQGIGWMREYRHVPASLIEAFEAFHAGSTDRIALLCEVEGYRNKIPSESFADIMGAASALADLHNNQAWEERGDDLTYFVRNCFDRGQVAKQFGELIDIFEDVMFFLATPPTPLEVREMAARAGLAMV